MTAIDGPFPRQSGHGARIRQFRRSHGLSQSDLARDVGMSQSHLSQIEGYDLVPNGVMLQRIAHRLGTTVEELIGEPDGNQPRDGVPHSSPAFQRNVQQAISSAINGMQTQIAADTIRPEIASITVEWRIDVERGTIDIHYHTVKHRE